MKDLEHVLQKVQHIVDDALKTKLGFTINPFTQDLSATIARIPLVDIDVDITLPYRKAKAHFTRKFITRALQEHQGNISEAAKILAIERRTLHRLINKLSIQTETIRTIKRAYVRNDIQDAVTTTIARYERSLHPEKVNDLYQYSAQLTQDISSALKTVPCTFEEAIKLFDRTYIHELLKRHKSVTEAAKAAGLRPETIHRKKKDT